eukprot:XP_011672411.1 PREDICTED: lactase-like protein [Strongylocentrotus purpuratus]
MGLRASSGGGQRAEPPEALAKLECNVQGVWINELGSVVSFHVDTETGLMTGEYTTKVGEAKEFVAYKKPEFNPVPTVYDDFQAEFSSDPIWPLASSEWLKVVPWGFRRLLNWIKTNYGDVPIYVTENGVSEPDGPLNLDDELKTKYYRSCINEALKASKIDGVNLQGYFAWTLLDNFEWASGVSERFGLYHVDFNDPARTRRAKSSALTYTQIIKDNGFPSSEDGKIEL